ncbi:uncharacterized protein BX664DRAFT_325995 [Halteromyces radiatus]|uniref:uncharacterized protein n=1 Tax=Halteromyces radiatus TaxID=101107 RepID=UPI00221E3867|nr:uncharacterized protein BX664DRAFT_325995 [Halteromyces radiatus]KAI8097273.1 hypothetical protein BX664DRAFT_325995 [Halteromyces radiatus]
MSQQTTTDALAALLSLPMDFTIDPLVTLHSSSNQPLFPLTSDLIPQKDEEDSQSTTSSSPSLSSDTSSMSQKKKVVNKPIIKKSRLSLEDKDQKTKERILRNRAAAQESRDKKRRYVADLESNNEQLRNENESMNKRIKLLETQNQSLTTQLSDFTRQIAELQQQLKFTNTSSSLLVHGFCDSARIAKRLFYLICL